MLQGAQGGTDLQLTYALGGYPRTASSRRKAADAMLSEQVEPSEEDLSRVSERRRIRPGCPGGCAVLSMRDRGLRSRSAVTASATGVCDGSGERPARQLHSVRAAEIQVRARGAPSESVSRPLRSRLL